MKKNIIKLSFLLLMFSCVNIDSTINPIKSSLANDQNLKVMSFNIWHGGVGDAKTEQFVEGGDYADSNLKALNPGLALYRLIDVIKLSKAEIIGLQETYGSGEAIADALGYIYCEKIYPSGNNISIVSKYEIESILEKDPYFNLLGTKIKLREKFLRVNNIKTILKAANKYSHLTDKCPIIIAGDHNSPSHLDYRLQWPVSKLMQEAGFINSYKEVKPDITTYPGITWSPRFDESQQDQQRIDYIYYKGENIKAINSRVIDQYEGNILPEYYLFPSDHAAIIREFEIK